MQADTVQPTPILTYAALLADARIAALSALTDILATSDDPTEKRLAATAILRLPEPDEPHAAAPPQERTHARSREDNRAPSSQPPQTSDSYPALAAAPAPQADSAEQERYAARLRIALNHAGYPTAEHDDPYERFGPLPAPAALEIILAAGDPASG